MPVVQHGRAEGRTPCSFQHPLSQANEVQNYRAVLERFRGSSTAPDVVVMDGKILPRYVKRNFFTVALLCQLE